MWHENAIMPRNINKKGKGCEITGGMEW
jgi:hypothetical protein